MGNDYIYDIYCTSRTNSEGGVGMKVIIAGSRTITDIELVEKAIEDSPFDITEVVTGCARGVDTLGIKFAWEHMIPKKEFPADWDKYGKAAGFIRNKQMAEYADALIAVWDGKSKGTAHMIDIAKKEGLEVFIYEE